MRSRYASAISSPGGRRGSTPRSQSWSSSRKARMEVGCCQGRYGRIASTRAGLLVGQRLGSDEVVHQLVLVGRDQRLLDVILVEAPELQHPGRCLHHDADLPEAFEPAKSVAIQGLLEPRVVSPDRGS